MNLCQFVVAFKHFRCRICDLIGRFDHFGGLLDIPDQLPDNTRLPEAISDEEDQTIISLSDISSMIEDIVEVDNSAEITADSQNVAIKSLMQVEKPTSQSQSQLAIAWMDQYFQCTGDKSVAQ